jgi:hypothetical protein
MITEKILDIFMFVPTFLISALPEISFEIPENVFDGLSTIFYGIGYLVPVPALIPIILISLWLDFNRAGISLISRVKSFFPLFGK